MSITTGLSATKTGFELLKSLREVLRREHFDPAEINARLLELQEYLLDARQALNEADEENRTLREALNDKKRIEEFGKQFVHREGLYLVRRLPILPKLLGGKSHSNTPDRAKKWPLRNDRGMDVRHT